MPDSNLKFYRDLENRESFGTTKIRGDGIIRDFPLVQIPLVVHVGKLVYTTTMLGEEIEKGFCRKETVSIEFHALRSHRHREIKFAARLEEAQQIFHASPIPIRIEHIAVTPKTEMFYSMETRRRIATRKKVVGQLLHEIGLYKLHIRNMNILQRTNIRNVNQTKRGYMRYKTVQSRTDIEVHLRVVDENPSCHKQVLVEILSACHSCLYPCISKKWAQSA